MWASLHTNQKIDSIKPPSHSAPCAGSTPSRTTEAKRRVPAERLTTTAVQENARTEPPKPHQTIAVGVRRRIPSACSECVSRDWALAFRADRAIRTPSPRTAKAQRWDFAAIAAVLAVGTEHVVHLTPQTTAGGNTDGLRRLRRHPRAPSIRRCGSTAHAGVAGKPRRDAGQPISPMGPWEVAASGPHRELLWPSAATLIGPPNRIGGCGGISDAPHTPQLTFSRAIRPRATLARMDPAMAVRTHGWGPRRGVDGFLDEGHEVGLGMENAAPQCFIDQFAEPAFDEPSPARGLRRTRNEGLPARGAG